MEKNERFRKDSYETANLVENFCIKYGIKICKKYAGKSKTHFYNDNAIRDIYKITIQKIDDKGLIVSQFSFDFGDSINWTEKNDLRRSALAKPLLPTDYDILASLEKYDVGSLDDFINEYGLTFNSAKDFYKIQSIYTDCVKMYSDICLMFGGEGSPALEELREIY